MKTVWVNGCFDVLHIGHIELLKYAKSLGDKLVVGIDVDSRVKEMKGQERPINTTIDRMNMLKSIKYVDDVTFFGTDDELRRSIELHGANIMVVGSDYKNKKVIGSDLVDDVLYFNRIGDYSTTNIINK